VEGTIDFKPIFKGYQPQGMKYVFYQARYAADPFGSIQTEVSKT